MKYLFFLNSLIFIHFLSYSQPKIDKITWIGENNEYLNISKKKTSLQKGMEYQEFKVAKFDKNNFIILSKTDDGKKIEQKYNIVHFTKDTLILVPKGEDIFKLAEINEENQYIFFNSMLTYKFEEFYAEAVYNNYGKTYRLIIYIDSAKNSRIVFKDEYFDETTIYTAPISEYDYGRLIKILSSCDIGCIPEEDTMIDKECPDLISEIRYNGQIKIFKGCIRFPDNCDAKLGNFLSEYVVSKTGLYVPKYMVGFWIHR